MKQKAHLQKVLFKKISKFKLFKNNIFRPKKLFQLANLRNIQYEIK